MTTIEIIEKKIKQLSASQLRKVRKYIDIVSRDRELRLRKREKSINEYFGIYNYSKKKIESDLRKMRAERSRDDGISS